MGRNASGTYSLPAGSTVTNGDTSDATDVNTPLADLETDMNTARPIVAGGTGATTAAGALTNLGLTATAAELNSAAAGSFTTLSASGAATFSGASRQQAGASAFTTGQNVTLTAANTGAGLLYLAVFSRHTSGTAAVSGASIITETATGGLVRTNLSVPTDSTLTVSGADIIYTNTGAAATLYLSIIQLR